MGKLRVACWPSPAQAEMHSGPRICTQLSLFLLSGPPSFVLQLPEDRPLHMLSATGLLVAFGLGKDWGPGRGPELSLPGTVPVSSTGQSCVALSRVGKSWGQGRGRAQTGPEALPATGSRPHMCP